MLRRFRVLHYEKEKLYVSRDLRIHVLDSDQERLSFYTKVSSPMHSLLLYSLSPLSRLLRASIHDLIMLSPGECIVVTRHHLIKISKERASFPLVKFRRGIRPLKLAVTPGGSIYFGEYFDNRKREEVYIYCLRNGEEKCEVSFVFTRNAIRHVHGIFFDHYDSKIWVTSGDLDEESAIWVTDDNFLSLRKVVSGSQHVRAVQLLFTRTHVYFGSDSPLEKNYICRLDKRTGEIERLQPVGSSVLWGCNVGKALFFSTAVEPSGVNRCNDACIWGSPNGEDWKCIARFRKDIWPMKLFQYGQIFFPSGENNTGFLWFTPFATEQHHTIQRLNVEEIF